MNRKALPLLILGLAAIYVVCSVGLSMERTGQMTPNSVKDASAVQVSSYVQSPTQGDINVSDYETLHIQDLEYNLTGRIIAQNHATILVENARVTLSPSDNDGISIVLNDQSRLLVTNSTIDFARSAFDCQIVLQNEANASFTETTFTGWGYVVGRDASTVYVERSSIGSGLTGLHSPGAVAYGTSRVTIEDSRADGVYVWENSTASVDRSVVGTVRTAWAENGETTIDIADSQVDTIETLVVFEQPPGTTAIHVTNCTVEYAAYIHDNSTIFFEKSSVASVTATGNATVWLIESSVGDVSLEDNARVLLGWRLPFFGLVGVPYSLILILRVGSVMTIVIGIALVSYAVCLRRRSQSDGNG